MQHHDELNRQITQTVQGAVNPFAGTISLVTKTSYNDAQNLVTTIDPYSIKTETTADPLGRVIQTKLTDAFNSKTQTSYNIYNSRNLLVTAINAANSQSDFTYDDLGRIHTSTSYTGTYNSGTPLTTTFNYVDSSTPKVTTIGPAPQNEQVEKSYDEAGQLRQTKVSNSSSGDLVTKYTYDGQGNQISVTDPLSHTTYYGYENTGWLTAVTQTVTSGGSAQTLNTSYGYDLAGNQVSATDPLNHTTTYTYNSRNRLIKVTDPGTTAFWGYEYDGLGRSTLITDPKNQVTKYTYDAASRLLNFTTDAAGVNTANKITTSYAYNNDSQPIWMNDQTGGTSGPVATTNYIYDGFNRLQSVSSPQGIVNYKYDDANRRSELDFGLPGTSTPNLKQVTYSYDALDRATAITATNWLTSSQTVAFNYSGMHLDKLLYPNGITATYSYDGAGRLTNINQVNSSNATVFSVGYTLDALGNRTAQNENLNGVTRQVNYSYDELSRLITENYPSGNPNSRPLTSTYTYDKAGNRTQMVTNMPAPTKGSTGMGPLTLTTNYTYNDANQLVTRADSGTATPFNSYNYNYTYDANGSVVSEATNTTNVEATNYSYDVRNRLTGWQKTAKSTTTAAASFSYDGANNRLSMTYGGQTTSYLQDAAAPLPVVLLEKKGSDDPSIFFYPTGASTTPLFQVSGHISDTLNGLWYHSDGLGSVRALTLSSDSSKGASGTIVDTNSYSAFGLSAGENNTGKVDNSHKFAGEQLDPTGLYYNRARYYNPILGRFIGRDPIGVSVTDPSTLNRYVYGANNPGLLVDPSGNTFSNTPQPIDEHNTPISDEDAQTQVDTYFHDDSGHGKFWNDNQIPNLSDFNNVDDALNDIGPKLAQIFADRFGGGGTITIGINIAAGDIKYGVSSSQDLPPKVSRSDNNFPDSISNSFEKDPNTATIPNRCAEPDCLRKVLKSGANPKDYKFGSWALRRSGPHFLPPCGNCQNLFNNLRLAALGLIRRSLSGGNGTSTGGGNGTSTGGGNGTSTGGGNGTSTGGGDGASTGGGDGASTGGGDGASTGGGDGASTETSNFQALPTLPSRGGFTIMPRVPWSGGFTIMPRVPWSGGFTIMPRVPWSGGFTIMPRDYWNNVVK